MTVSLRFFESFVGAFALVAMAAVVAAGCGTGGDTSSTKGPKSSETKSLSKAALAKQANRVCRDTREKLDDLGPEPQFSDRQELLEKLQGRLADLRGPSSTRDELKSLVIAAKYQAKTYEADEEVRIAQPTYDSATSLSPEALEILSVRNRAFAKMKINKATDNAISLDAKACADMQGVPAAAEDVPTDTLAVVECTTFDRLVVYSQLTATLRESDVAGRVECGTTITISARAPINNWYFVSAPSGLHGLAQLSPRFTPRDPYVFDNGECGARDEDGSPSASANLVSTDFVDITADVMDTRQPIGPSVLTGCMPDLGKGVHVTCISCRPIDVQDLPQPRGGGRPDMTVVIQNPTTGQNSTGCTLHLVVRNIGGGWAPGRFAVRIKTPRGQKVMTFSSYLGFRPGYRYETTTEHLLGINVGQRLTGPYGANVDPGNSIREANERNNTTRYSNPNIMCQRASR